MAGTVPVADDIFTWPSDEPQLIGSRCEDCGTHIFPKQDSCQRCSGSRISEVLLSRRGTLWTWTTQGFPPKSPPYLKLDQPFTPYTVGYIDIPGQLRVESRLTPSDPAELEIGMEMQLEIVPLGTVEGEEILTFAFRPLTEAEKNAS